MPSGVLSVLAPRVDVFVSAGLIGLSNETAVGTAWRNDLGNRPWLLVGDRAGADDSDRRRDRFYFCRHEGTGRDDLLQLIRRLLQREVGRYWCGRIDGDPFPRRDVADEPSDDGVGAERDASDPVLTAVAGRGAEVGVLDRNGREMDPELRLRIYDAADDRSGALLRG